MQYAQITNSSSRHISMGNTAVERFCMVQQAAIAFGCPSMHLGSASLKQPKKMISCHTVGFIIKQRDLESFYFNPYSSKYRYSY